MKIPKNELLARTCSGYVEHLLFVALMQRRPADRVLSSLLRRNTSLKEKDRLLLKNTVDSTFRWWGWLRELAPVSWAWQERQNQEENHLIGQNPLPTRAALWKWSPVLLASQYLAWDHIPSTGQVLSAYAAGGQRKARWLWMSTPADPAKRMARVSRLFFREKRPAEHWPSGRLIPGWSHDLIDCPEPLETLIRWLQKPSTLWIRLQTEEEKGVFQELRKGGLRISKRVSLRGCIAAAVSGSRNIYQLPPYQKGRLEVQDLASQCIGHICDPKPGERWWDACAGAGGKSLLLAGLMRGRGQLVSTDLRPYKLRDLRRRASRADLHNIQTGPWDGGSVDKRRSGFDGVLVDAPCSGSGTWRRQPDARWSVVREDVKRHAQLQLQLLLHASRAVRSGGALVYATCSIFAEENEEVVFAFLHEAGSFQLEPFRNPLDKSNTPGYVQIWPWTADTDSMFVARFRRNPNNV